LAKITDLRIKLNSVNKQKAKVNSRKEKSDEENKETRQPRNTSKKIWKNKL